MTNSSALNGSPRDIPVIFSGPMVQALLSGHKTMTRRLAWKVKPVWNDGGVIHDGAGGQMDYVEPHWVTEGKATTWQKVRPGDRLWVRENHAIVPQTAYRASEGVQQTICPSDPDMAAIYTSGWERSAPRWKPSIHMPRWASRLTLVVTDTKIERLQHITPDDAWNEGVERQSRKVRQMWLFGATPEGRDAIYKRACVWEFEDLWKSLHGDDAWDANPEVVALTFTVHKSNIDALPAAAAA